MYKNTIRRILAKLGYEIRKTKGRAVPFENFANLALAYEKRLNDVEDLITPNHLRAQLLARLMGTPPSEAYYIIQALSKCRDLPGDVCEFGVAQGETSALIANEIAASEKRLHLFDSFEGLPSPTEKDQLQDDIFSLGSMEAYAGAMACPDDMVRARLNAISFPPERYILHKGFIEQLIHTATNLPSQVCFAYVDFDFYEPIMITLEFLHPITPVGAMIVVDDYGHFSTGAKTAVDEFVEAKCLAGMTYECLIPDATYGYFAVLTKRS